MTSVRGGRPARPAYLSPVPILLVIAGGALGTLCRELVEVAVPQFGGLPWPTFAVNMVGAFALGVLYEALSAPSASRGATLARLALGTGFLGGFTTYSSLAVESSLLLESGRLAEGLGYALVTLVAGGLLSFAGILAGTAIRRRRERAVGGPGGRDA